MNNLLLKLVFIFSIFLPSLVWAFVQAKPAKCPSVDAVVQSSLKVLKTENGYDAIKYGKFDTAEIWTFVIHHNPSLAKDPREAIALTKNSIVSLEGPVFFALQVSSYKPRWLCFYRNSANQRIAVALRDDLGNII